jgi:(S)-ureidoglycine aminohydrolase
MRQSLGETRSSIGDRHALICPDSHERTTLPGWPGSSIIVLISPQMGAKFTEYFVDVAKGASGQAPAEGIERFFFVVEGQAKLMLEGKAHDMTAEGYAFLPANSAHVISSDQGARLIIIERRYVPLAGRPAPQPVVNNARKLPVTRLKGDENLPLQKLLPEDLAFDCEVNIMGFTPGASLHYVETHFMEHGLLMLDGGGVYRLDKSWYSVSAGDVIWMGPFCPQWFGAIGRSNARYLIYKNWNRTPFES